MLLLTNVSAFGKRTPDECHSFFSALKAGSVPSVTSSLTQHKTTKSIFFQLVSQTNNKYSDATKLKKKMAIKTGVFRLHKSVKPHLWLSHVGTVLV